MTRRVVAGLLLPWLALSCAALGSPPRLLLTPQRLHRLKLEHERQSSRWLAFEQRVQNAADSPERGFELALYFVITGDEAKGREAVKWAAAHACDVRQSAIVLSWSGDLASAAERKAITLRDCAPAAGRFERLRDALFLSEVRGTEVTQPEALHLQSVPEGPELYALAEYLSVYRQLEGEDLRRESRITFMKLPSLVLLALDPHQVDHPSWQQHAAALALVALDPNLQSSQFLQSWAMEDRFTPREGPGVAYELFWADPYLPGVGFENMQPWAYDAAMQQLYARSSWRADACWIHISRNGVEQKNCDPGWSSGPATFGTLTLQPFVSKCVKLAGSGRDKTVIVRAPRPAASLKLYTAKNQQTATSDAAGLWTVPTDEDPERVCLER